METDPQLVPSVVSVMVVHQPGDWFDETLEALAALRDAIDEGFRGTVASNGWPMMIDPYLKSLRGQPGFEAMVSEIDEDLARMQRRLADAEEDGSWEELRSLASQPSPIS